MGRDGSRFRRSAAVGKVSLAARSVLPNSLSAFVLERPGWPSRADVR